MYTINCNACAEFTTGPKSVENFTFQLQQADTFSSARCLHTFVAPFTFASSKDIWSLETNTAYSIARLKTDSC